METTEALDAGNPALVASTARDATATVDASTAAAELHGPELRTTALVVIALVVVLAAIRIAEAFFIPLVISVFLSYALSPLVARLEMWRVPRALGAAFVMVAFVALCGAAVYRAGSDAVDLLELLPQARDRKSVV